MASGGGWQVMESAVLDRVLATTVPAWRHFHSGHRDRQRHPL